MEDTVAGRCSLEDFGDSLRATGISMEAAGDYIQEVKQRLEGRLGALQEEPDQPGPSSGVADPNADSKTASGPSNNPSSGDINDEVGWALLRSKLINTRFDSHTGDSQPNVSIADLLKALNPPSSSDSSIPSLVLSIAPHLASLSKADTLDEHLHKTWELCQAFSTDKAIEPIIDLMQSQQLQEPIPRSIWRKIIQDEFVDFERLYGSTDRNYSHKDDYKEFARGFVLARKEQIYSKKFIHTEADWSQMYSAWEVGVLSLYPHQQIKLQKYRLLVVDLFRATPHNTSIAICFDAEARDCYSRSPYHLDDREMLHAPLLVQLFSGSTSSNKCDSDSSPDPPKRAMVPCQNWSLGLCDDPCNNQRKHGICSECGEKYRAKDVDGCLASLRDKRRGANSGFNAGEGSSSRA